MNAQEKLFDDICNSFAGFGQFRNRPEFYEINFIEIINQTCYFDVLLKIFDGIDKTEINRYSYGPVDGTYYRNIEGSVTSGSPECIYIRFKADSKTVIKNIFGHLTDAPHTTFSPETLNEILKENGVDEKLIDEVMNTIHSQCNIAFNSGWLEAKTLYN